MARKIQVNVDAAVEDDAISLTILVWGEKGYCLYVPVSLVAPQTSVKAKILALN